MEDIPVTGLDELDKHLDDLVRDPTIPLNAKVIDEVELQLTESNTPPLVTRFLPRLTTILKQYPSDPTLLANLTTKLLRPVSFTQVLTLASPESLIQALDSPAPSANLLAMTILHKATTSPSQLASMPDLVAAFLRRWLASPFVEVGQLGGKVLGDLIQADHASSASSPFFRAVTGPGEPHHQLITDLCAGRHPDTRDDAHQLSLAQARLLRVLPRLAGLNILQVAGSALSNGNRPGAGLLQWAATGMVDKSDRLLHLSLVDFFKELVVVMRTAEGARAPGAVETLRALLVEAMAEDELLRGALAKLPEEMVEEEVEEMRAWLKELVPGQVWEVPVR
ncbi:hypothetical protein QBC39DRAFT_68870 [Podospora conica]|nr:hypothetical protein QBC39DRAFT_68870 [Schizothecium conicum]